MDTSHPKDASGQGSEGEEVEQFETLFGYSKRSEGPADAEGVDLDAPPAE
jgi:hypothetical protein